MTANLPTGWVATCRCGVNVGALDAERTPRAEQGPLLSKWLTAGCTITPRFTGSWSETIAACQCLKEPQA